MAKKEEFKENGEEEKEVCRADFPPSFVFGVATASYQIEGACNEGSRGASIWDSFSHTEGKIIDGSSGDVAVGHYHRYSFLILSCIEEDVNLIQKFGFDGYRFSISWSRIFPDGLGTKVNDKGSTFYNNLINALLEKELHLCRYLALCNFVPLGSSFASSRIGGWLNKQIVTENNCFEGSQSEKSATSKSSRTSSFAIDLDAKEDEQAFQFENVTSSSRPVGRNKEKMKRKQDDEKKKIMKMIGKNTVL
ncbi:hypothetical protein CRYUN_Cryun05aG0076100 [Craigia yunnanensis]